MFCLYDFVVVFFYTYTRTCMLHNYMADKQNYFTDDLNTIVAVVLMLSTY